MPKNAEVVQILAEFKVIQVNLRWRVDPPRSDRHKLTAMVLAPDSRRVLELRGNIGRSNRSYVLLYQGEPIRKYTVHDKHRNPDGSMVRGPHKHRWDEIERDAWAYIPNDIAQGDPNHELLDFLRECNVELRGAYAQQNFF